MPPGWRGGAACSAVRLAVLTEADPASAIKDRPLLIRALVVLTLTIVGASATTVVANLAARDGRPITFMPFFKYGSVAPGPVPGHAVLAGWDMGTGFGSPIGGPFVADLRAARNALP